MDETYPAPENGWTCFHCGETFKKPGMARDHFGKYPHMTPECILRKKKTLFQNFREMEEQVSKKNTLIGELIVERNGQREWNKKINEELLMQKKLFEARIETYQNVVGELKEEIGALNALLEQSKKE